MSVRTHDTAPETDPGDHTVIVRVHLHWVESVPEVMASKGPCVGHVAAKGDGWQVAFAVQRGSVRRQLFFADVSADASQKGCWHLQQLGPGVWDVSPSIFFDGQFHGFVTIVGVPTPAPWERANAAEAEVERDAWKRKAEQAMPIARRCHPLVVLAPWPPDEHKRMAATIASWEKDAWAGGDDDENENE